MATETLNVNQAITLTDMRARYVRNREALYRLGWLCLVGAMVAVALDAVVQLPDAGRAIVSLAGLAALGWGIRRFQRQKGQRLSAERVAMLVEEKEPALDNALINAVQFGRLLDGTHQPLAHVLMQREIQRAESSVARIDLQTAVDSSTLKRAKRTLGGLGALLGLSALLLPSLYRAVLPRYLDPFGDHPPFCFTRFFVEPPGARVRYGDELPLNIRVAGQRPRSLFLLTSTDGKTWSSAPLFQVRRNEYVQKLEDLQSDTMYFVRSESGRSRRYRAQVITAPHVRSVEVTYCYPEYTHEKPRSEELTAKGIQGVSGTEVKLKVVCNRALGTGRLRLSLRGEREVRALPLEPSADQSKHGVARFALRRSGQFAIDLVGTDGLTTPAAVAGKVVLLRDEQPLVYITEPGRPAFATPDVKVPIVIEAEDNFGLRTLQLHRSLNESPDLPLDVALPPSHPRQAMRRIVLDMADLGVRAGDTITYYATAYDTDPEHRNYSDSESFWLRIISRDQYKQLLRSQAGLEELLQKYRNVLQPMKDLAEEQRELAGRTRQLKEQLSQPPTPEALRRAKELAAEQKDLSARAAKLAKQMAEMAKQEPLFDIERGLNRRLAQLAARLGQVASGMASAGRNLSEAGAGHQSGANAGKALQAQQEALRRLGELGQQSQAMERMLKELERVYPLYEDLAKFLALVEAQGNLVLKAKEFETETSFTLEQKARMEDLGQWQEKIREALAEVMGDLRKHAKEVEGEYPTLARQAQAFVQRVERLPIAEHMTAAQEAFGKHRGRRGHSEAQAALDLLKKLIEECKSCQGQANQDLGRFCFGLGMSLGDTLAQCASRFGFGLGQGSGQGMGTGYGLFGFSGEGAFGLAMAGVPGAGTTNLSVYGPQSPAGSRTTPGGQRKRQRPKSPGASEEGALPPGQVEVLHARPTGQPNASEVEQDRYPAEYKRLVREYFQRVSEDSGKR